MSEPVSTDHAAERIKEMLRGAGVPVERKRIRDNQSCPCGSGIRYDLCCKGKRKL